MLAFKAILIVLFLLVSPLSVSAATVEISGRVVAVSDGDTLKIISPTNQLITVRLAEIDAPEKKQPYGNDAKKALSDLAYNKNVKILQTAIDRYGRSVARVYDGNNDINAALVEQGAVWVYRQYSHDPILLKLEAAARANKKGLWGLQQDQIVPPWEWRHTSEPRSGATAQVTKQNVKNDICGTKRYCKQMASCAEARHYLMDCGLSRLDGDGDGMPCEALCR